MTSSNRKSTLSRRQFLQLSAVTGAGAMLAACGAKATVAPAEDLLSSGNSIPLDKLAELAKGEGEVTVIALPRDWANYGEIIDTFKKKYGMKVNELFPDAGSSDELEAIRANKGNKGAQNPDSVDVGISYAADGKKEGLWSKYKVAGWDSIPDNLKDPDGTWWVEYYGVLCFEVNKQIITEIPQDWEDLLKPIYKNGFSVGDPTKGNESVMAVWAAGLSRTGGKVEGAAEEGLKFMAEMKKAGNLVPVSVSAGSMAKGETPIGARWDYLAMADVDTLKGNPEIGIVLPKSFILGGPYAGAINATGPHPYAARLWVEYYMSDEGQLGFLKGYAHPARFNDMVKRNVIPAELSAKLPPAENYEKAFFPKLEDIVAAKKVIAEGWRKVVYGE